VYHPLGYYSSPVEGQALIHDLQARAAFSEQLSSLAGQSALGATGQAVFHQLAAGEKSSIAATNAHVSALLNSTGPTPSAPHGYETVIPTISYAQIPIGQMMAAAEATAYLAQQQLAADVKSLQDYNAAVAMSNSQALIMLADLSGKSFGSDRTSWDKWLTDLEGYAYVSPPSPVEKPTVVEDVPISVVPQPTITTVGIEGPVMNIPTHSCFGAGTLVWTPEGKRPIESIQQGDQVLSRNASTGVLGYRSVVSAFHNPPNSTYRIDLDGESLVATGIHRLWKTGAGWVMTRDLKPGDRLRTVSGTITVRSVKADTVRPVYNLELAGAESFLVGNQGILAHDNSLVNPVEKPFDRVPSAVEFADAAP
jgi:hypothetical protein